MKNEIEPSKLHVLGVTICSRHGRLFEVVEMINFLRAAYEKKQTDPIAELFYDSNSSYLTFTFKDGYEDIAGQRNHPILLLALDHITQFEWNGETRHSPHAEKCEYEERE